MIIITKIYEPIPSSDQMVASFQKQGYEVAVLTGLHKGNGQTMRELYECFKRAVTGHIKFCYSDGADTYCQKPFDAPDDHILYSTEKACYPIGDLAQQYPKGVKSPWKFLNGGGVCGPLEIMMEFMEKYGLITHENDINGQLELHHAFLKARKDKFPIKLDTDCRIFQSVAFANEGDFEVDCETGLILNKVTGITPAILHANGRTKTPENWPFKIW
jgi:hypothetical protein